MLKKLKNSFIQTTLGSIIWVASIASLQHFNQVISFNFIWHIIFIGALFGLVFGVVYPYLWNYSTLKSYQAIIISTLINTLCSFSVLYLYSSELFHFAFPYVLAVLGLTFVLHIIGFYFYSKAQHLKLQKELNQLI